MKAERANLDLVPIPEEGVELAELQGEGVLYCHEKMVMVYLNETARVIWLLCDGHRTLEEIVKTLAGEFPESADQVGIDVLDAIEAFSREGILQLGKA